jgi:hypothetical protein
MAHLISPLESGHSIGHYGRLVFAMVSRHFIAREQLIALLKKDSERDRAQAEPLLRQTEARNYNPPKRERGCKSFLSALTQPILPNATSIARGGKDLRRRYNSAHRFARHQLPED